MQGDVRSAFHLGLDETKVDYFSITDAIQLVSSGKTLVGTRLVTPYPPGYPVIVPGQIISREVLKFLEVHQGEIHGFKREVGLRVFKEEYLMELGG